MPITASFQQSVEGHLTLDDPTAIYHQNPKGESDFLPPPPVLAHDVARIPGKYGGSSGYRGIIAHPASREAAFRHHRASRSELTRVDQRRQVTREGLEEIKAELADMIEVKRPQIIAAVAEARSHGDLRENAAYDAARHDQMMLERRIQEFEDLIRNAEIVETNSNSNVIGLGTTVIVDLDGMDETFTVVGAAESRPSAGRISVESPIGRALMGKRVGDTAVAMTPRGRTSMVVKEIVR